MGLLWQLVGAISLFVAGFELWRFLVGLGFALIMKAGLLSNISVNPNTKLSVTAAIVKISFWTHLWKFLRSPKHEKLVVLELPSVQMLVVQSIAESREVPHPRETVKLSTFWQTLDTSVGLRDLRHPVWKAFRAWIPRLVFIFRCVHAVEVGIGCISVDIVHKDKDTVTPVFSIQHGSVFVSAMFRTKTEELSITAKLSQAQPMKVHIRSIDATAALGGTEITICVPISRDLEDVRAPIPSTYSVVCDLIQANLDFEQLILLTLQSKQHNVENPDYILDDSDEGSNAVEACIFEALTMLRLAEITPANVQCEFHRIELNMDAKGSSRGCGASCSLGLNNIRVVLSGDSSQELGTKTKAPRDNPLVFRKADLSFGPLLVELFEVDGQNNPTEPTPLVKLEGLKVTAEVTLSVQVSRHDMSDEISDNDIQQPSLCFGSTVSGESRGLDLTISNRIERWVSSCCLVCDQQMPNTQTSGLHAPALVEDAYKRDEWPPVNYYNIELDAQFKLLKTEITFISLDRVSEVLPSGVPSMNLSLGEISIYGHPFVNEDHLGVRAKADIQCSRLKVFYFSGKDLAKNHFLSLDFARVFIAPVATMMQSDTPADVEMEAEWVEVKWAPEVLHAIGGVLELGIFTLGPFLHESRIPVAESSDVHSDDSGWKAASSSKIPQMRQFSDVAQDTISPDEMIAFRCAAKRICVTFPYLYDGQRHLDCVTVDTFAVSSEATTRRLRISIIDARAFPSRQSSSEVPLSIVRTSHKPGPFRRKSFTSRASRGHTMRSRTPSTNCEGDGSEHDAVFFVADCFCLEENLVAGSDKTVVDLFVNGVRMEWDLSTQLRIMELIRRITFSSWEMIYRARSAYAIYCTPPDSIYNRPHGMNPPLDNSDECSRYEKLFPDLISASGDKLHRLHATNVFVHAKLCAEVDIHVSVGVFAGDDLPEVWLFKNISMTVNGLEMAKIGVLRVRHTLDKQQDYVFGEFEEMLRKRLFACKRSKTTLDQTLVDGVLIDISKIHLRTSLDFKLLSYVDAIQRSFDPFNERIVSAMSSYWRPQQELFYQFFLRTPVTSRQKEIWLRLGDVGFECLGNPLESWLEEMYPVWIEELAEQELRTHMLDDHVATLKLTNVELLCDNAYQEMKTLLTEKNARMYIQKVKKLRSLSRESSDDCSGSLINLGVGHIDVDVAFEENIASSWAAIQELDEATSAMETAFKMSGRNWKLFAPSCLMFLGVQNKIIVTDLTVRMKRFPTPLMSCDSLSVEGQVYLAVYNCGSGEVYSELNFDPMAAARVFMNLAINASSPVLYFNPGYLYALDELAGLTLAFLPLAVLDIDKQHLTSLVDIVRRLVHGKITISVRDAGVRLLCAATSFESTDYLEVVVSQIRAAYTCGSIDIDVTRVTAKIEPGSLSHIAEVSHLKLHVWLKWGCLGDPKVHYVYPIEFFGLEDTSAAGDHFVLNIMNPTSTLTTSFLESSARNPFQAYQATQLSAFISGKICPVDPGHGDPDGWSKRDMAARTAVVLYSKNVEWLIGFGRLYQKFPLYPLRRRNATGIKPDLPSTDILSILEGVTVEEFELIGLDLALYASEKYPVGLRAFIDDKISCTGALLKSSHDVFGGKSCETSDSSKAIRRLSFPVEDVLWIVQDLNVDAREIQVRICTPESGSRGESLVSVKYISLIVGGGTERVPTHDNGLIKLHSPPPMKRTIKTQPFAFSGPTIEVKERPKQSILEFFEIPHENPFSYRESDSDAETDFDVCDAGSSDKEGEESQNEVLDEFRRHGFLLGLLSKEVRVTVTMVALESLVDIADTWIQVVVASLPELFSDTADAAALPEKTEEIPVEPEMPMEESDPSPKKFTSLAQDPKFSGICLQGGADAPVSRDDSFRFEPTPYSNADTVRPIRRKSSVVASLLEPIRRKEESTPSHPTNSKLTHAFIMVKFEDCQISVQDQLHKGSVLVALNAGTLQHATSPDSSHDRIDLNVDGLQIFTAPLDVDVKSHAIWLKTLADGSYCPSSYGLLRQVIAPIPAQLTVWIDREKTLVKNRVKLEIPSIEVRVNLVSKDILEKLASTATELINAKLSERKGPDHSHLLHGYLRETQHQERSLHQLLALKKQLKWKIAALQWRQMCGWDYRMNERAMAAVSAAESARNLAFEIETSPLFRRRKMSSASVSSATTSISMVGSTATNRYEDEQFADELQGMTQQYDSLSRLTRVMASEIQRQLKPNPLPNVDLEFSLDRASLTLSGENVDIIRAQVGSLCFKMQLFEDQSGNFALTLRDLSVNNLSPGTPYPDLLQPAFSRSWEGDDMFLRIDAEIAKPVGGITVVQHFEVNVHPIQVCITQEVIMQLVAFFSPSDHANSTKEEQREEVRSQFLQARSTSNSTSDGRVGSAIIKAVKVAGKAAAHPLSLGRNHRADSDDELLASSRKTRGGALHHISEDPTQWMAKLANLSEENEVPVFGSTSEGEQQHNESAERELSEMKDRAKNSILFKRIRLGAVEVVLTYKNKKSNASSSTPHLHLPHATQPQALEDMRGFEVKTHALVYSDKTCSPMDLLLRIRRDILLDVLSQVGRNFTNIGNFLRDQFDPLRWDALAPLKSLSTTVSSLTTSGYSHTGAVVPLVAQPETPMSSSDSKAKETEKEASTPTSSRPTELLHEWLPHDNLDALSDHYDADSSTPNTPTSADAVHPKQVKAKRSLAKLFSRKKSSSPLPSPVTQ